MDIIKIPGFGRFGIYIDNLDLDNISIHEWNEIAILQSRFLLVILRNVTLSSNDRYERLIKQLGVTPWQKTQIDPYTPEWQTFANTDSSNVHGWLWANQMCASTILSQGNTVGTSSFLQTVDWYESQSSSFRQELDNMVLIHQEGNGSYEAPLVVRTIGGDKGLHYTSGEGVIVKGMSLAESKNLFDTINSTLIDQKYVYKHNFSQGKDVCLVDNSACLHEWRSTDPNATVRIVYHDFSKVFPNYNPWSFEPYKSDYENNRSTDILM